MSGTTNALESGPEFERFKSMCESGAIFRREPIGWQRIVDRRRLDLDDEYDWLGEWGGRRG